MGKKHTHRHEHPHTHIAESQIIPPSVLRKHKEDHKKRGIFRGNCRRNPHTIKMGKTSKKKNNKRKKKEIKDSF